MLLGFKERFVPFVEDGSKTHTIRAHRKVGPRVGELCHCYTGLRQKGARLLGRWACVKVQPISLYDSGKLAIDNILLSQDEKNALAWVDGFRTPGYPDGSFAEMYDYWRRLGHATLPFHGIIIHWKYTGGPK